MCHRSTIQPTCPIDIITTPIPSHHHATTIPSPRHYHPLRTTPTPSPHDIGRVGIVGCNPCGQPSLRSPDRLPERSSISSSAFHRLAVANAQQPARPSGYHTPPPASIGVVLSRFAASRAAPISTLSSPPGHAPLRLRHPHDACGV